MTFFYTKRILPTNSTSEKELNYMRIPSVIMNSEKDLEGNYTAPSLGTLRKKNDPDGINHEIRLLPENLVQPYLCDSNIKQPIYYLPSTVFSFHNIITNKLSLMNPDSSLLNLLEDDDTNLCQSKVFSCSFDYVSENDTNTIVKKNYSFSQDGVLSSIYKICFNNSYNDTYNNTYYAFLITTYVNNNFTNEVLFPNSSSILNNIMSTREFVVGQDTNHLFTNVSLLYHTNLKEIATILPYIDESTVSENTDICSELVWVGARLFYTTIDNKICTNKHAVNMNIRPIPNHDLEHAFTPYFAKSTKELITKPIQYQNNTRSQWGINRGCPTTTNTKIGEYDYYGNIYIGDGTLSVIQPNNSKDLLLISDSVTLADLVDDTIEVYIILLPNF